jgi:cytidine deaminase
MGELGDPGDARRLLAEAEAAAEQAYCPYSRFSVGAAIETHDGSIVRGCNVENASYGLAVCAERSAVFAAVASGSRSFRALAVVAGGIHLPYPCGACRQVLAEFCGDDLRIYVALRGRLTGSVSVRLGDLLPRPFRV